MATNKTMLNYFTKMPSKAVVVEETNPRKLAPAFNRHHVEKFQDRLDQFDAELFKINNDTGNGLANNAAVDDNKSPCNHNELNRPINYIATIKSGQHKPFKFHRKTRGPLRARLLQYHEDVRPPYYGTWQKNSGRITGRRPFFKDDEVFDYEIDSEAEWDLGGPGESLKGDDSEDEEELDDYEIDMKTFVPHGYVSDDEMEVHSDQEEVPSSANQSIEEICDVEDDSGSVEIVCEKLSKPAPVMQPPLKQVKLDIKPITLGIYYENEVNGQLSDSKLQFLKTFRGVSCT